MWRAYTFFNIYDRLTFFVCFIYEWASEQYYYWWWISSYNGYKQANELTKILQGPLFSLYSNVKNQGLCGRKLQLLKALREQRHAPPGRSRVSGFRNWNGSWIWPLFWHQASIKGRIWSQIRFSLQSAAETGISGWTFAKDICDTRSRDAWSAAEVEGSAPVLWFVCLGSALLPSSP